MDLPLKTVIAVDDASGARGRTPSPQGARDHWPLLAILCALLGFAPISTAIYLPAMPAMEQALGARAGEIELTISSYFAGLCLGQLLWGAIGDRYGRRMPVALGIGVFILGSVGCALSTDASTVVVWRFIQALGACAGVALGRAMVRDLYSGNRAAQVLSMLTTVMAIAPLLAPLMGEVILTNAGWRAIFWMLAVLGLLTLAALTTISETLPAARRNRQPLNHAFADYAKLLRNRRLLSYAATGGFFFGGTSAFIAGTPFAFITYYKLSPLLYSLLFGSCVLGIILMNIFNVRLVMRYGANRLLGVGAGIAMIAGLALAVCAKTGWGGLVGLVIPLFVYVGMSGLIVANSVAGVLNEFPDRAGAASALAGAIHYSSGIVGVALLGVFADGTPWPMGALIALGGTGAFVCARFNISLSIPTRT